MTIKFSVEINADTLEEFSLDINKLSKMVDNGTMSEGQVYLIGIGRFEHEKIKAIKEVRQISGQGLREAKNIVDSVLDGSEVLIQKGGLSLCYETMTEYKQAGLEVRLRAC